MKCVLIVGSALLVAASFGLTLVAQAQECGGKKCDMAKTCDKDGDGKVSEAEKAEAKAACEAGKAPCEQELIAKFDKDGDGTLNDAEKEAAHDARKAEHHAAMIAKFDKDGDGKLSDAEKAEMDKGKKDHKGKCGQQGKCGSKNAPEATSAQ